MVRIPRASRPSARARPPRRAALLCALPAAAAVGAATAAPEVRTDDDYVAVVLEAEDARIEASDWNARWVVTGPDTGTDEDDDANHSDGASGGVYLELLPDRRVDEEDALIQEGPDANYWDVAGTGPAIAWTVDLPEPGRWYVHFRTYSTGTEDNGAHVGIDGTWPPSGRRFQACIAGGGWQWRSHQRDSGGVGSCGVGHTIWVDADEAGEHEIRLAAREDGFEVDALMLIRDLSDNTRICQPSGQDGISCRDGSLGGPDERVDVAVSLEGGRVEGDAPNRYRVVAAVENLDDWDVATNVTLAIGLGEHFELVEADPGCTFDGANLSCPIGGLAPTGPEDVRRFAIDVDAVGEDVVPSLTATVTADEEDERAENGTATFNGERLEPVPSPSLDAGLALERASVAAGEPVRALLTVSNAGGGAAGEVRAVLSVPDGLDVAGASGECTNARPVVCTLAGLAPGESVELDVQLVAAAPGPATLLYEVGAEGVGAITGSAQLTVAAAPVPAPGPDAGDAAGGDVPDGAPPVPAPDVDADVDAPASPSGEVEAAPRAERRNSGGGAAGGALLAALGAAAAGRRRRAGGGTIR